MLNRRKAMIGWLVYSAAKPLAKQAVKAQAKKSAKASTATSEPASGSGRGVAKIAARVVALAAVAGGLLYWRRSRSQDDEEPLT